MFLTAAITSALLAVVGVVLTALTLPGIWIMAFVALLCAWWQPGLYSPWTIGAVLLIAVLAEVAEGLSSAAGSARSGGSRAGVVGSLAGSILGLVAGTLLIPIPIVGSIAGGVVGAGLGALIAERGVSGRTWGESWKSGRGAAVGRALATVIKTAFAIAAAGVLIAGAFVN